MLKLNRRWMTLVMMAYMYLPICIFLIGYVKIWISILCIFAIGFALVRFYKNAINKKDDSDIFINLFVLIIIVVILTIIMYCMGYGGYKEQPIDWAKHNGILNDLIKKDWPVYYINGNEHSMLSYYVGAYMLPAFVGRICNHSYNVGVIVTWIYIEIGVLLVYFGIIKYVKIKKWYMQIFVIFIFLFLFGLQDIGKMILGVVDSKLMEVSMNYFFLADKLQYSSAFTLIRWVPTQGVFAWIVIILFLEYKQKIEYYVCIALPLLLYGVFPFAGVVIYMFLYAIYIFILSKEKNNIIKKMFSVENIIVLFSLGTILFLYFYGNVFSEKPEEMNFRFVKLNIKIICFIIFMVLPYIILLYKKYKNDILYYITFAILLFLPFTYMGIFNDFMMRVSIPALFVVILFVIRFLNESIEEYIKSKKISINFLLIVLIFVLGSITPIKELIYSAGGEKKIIRYESMQIFANRKGKYAKMDRNTLIYNYYAYDVDNNLFYKYIARVKDKNYKPVKSGKMNITKN